MIDVTIVLDMIYQIAAKAGDMQYGQIKTE